MEHKSSYSDFVIRLWSSISYSHSGKLLSQCFTPPELIGNNVLIEEYVLNQTECKAGLIYDEYHSLCKLENEIFNKLKKISKNETLISITLELKISEREITKNG